MKILLTFFAITLLLFSGCVKTTLPLITPSPTLPITNIPPVVKEDYADLLQQNGHPIFSRCIKENDTFYQINAGGGDFYTHYLYNSAGDLLEQYGYSPFYKNDASTPPHQDLSNYTCTLIAQWADTTYNTECSKITSEEGCLNNPHCGAIYIQGIEVETKTGGYSEPDIFQSCGPAQCKKYIVDQFGTVAEGIKYRLWCK